MRNVLTYICNKCKQHTNRVYYTITNNTLMLHYAMLFSAASNLDRFVNSKVRNDEPFIAIVSSNILFKSIVFLYCFLTGTKLIMISPKFAISEIVNTLLSKRNINILFVDKEVLSEIENLEVKEGVNIIEFFNYVGTTLKMTEILLESDNNIEQYRNPLASISKKGRVKNLLDTPSVSILSPGTTSESCITNIPYKLLGQSMADLSYFMGLKSTDKVSVIADFEFYPGVYTILGLLNGIHFVLPEKDTDLSSGEELMEMISKSNHRPNVVFISSNNFKKVWDSILLKVHSKRCVFTLAKYWLTKWIVTCLIHKELYNIFGKQIQKVHILNEELGFYVLDMLKTSKIMFSSSYGFLEQGNFLAFKDPEVFGHKDYIYKPGGTLIKGVGFDDETIDKVVINKEEEFTTTANLSVGEICAVVEESEHIVKTIKSTDIGLLIPNIPNQGDRKYLYVYGRKSRHLNTTHIQSLDLIERSIKDTWIIRDCFLQPYCDGPDWKYKFVVEVREVLLDSKQVSWKEVEDTVRSLAEDFNKNSAIKLTHYAILKFDGMRNVAGKLQYYNM